MTARSKTAVADEVAAIRELLSDLEVRLNRVGGVGKREFSGASDDIYEFVDEALGRIVKRARDGADSVADGAARLGGDTVKRVVEEVEQRPLMMLGVAAGIGFLFGLTRR
jgi:ElaB/YqjD/DUF883 family membrane-anchored ribosome-binding protein